MSSKPSADLTEGQASRLGSEPSSCPVSLYFHLDFRTTSTFPAVSQPKLTPREPHENKDHHKQSLLHPRVRHGVPTQDPKNPNSNIHAQLGVNSSPRRDGLPIQRQRRPTKRELAPSISLPRRIAPRSLVYSSKDLSHDMICDQTLLDSELEQTLTAAVGEHSFQNANTAEHVESTSILPISTNVRSNSSLGSASDTAAKSQRMIKSKRRADDHIYSQSPATQRNALSGREAKTLSSRHQRGHSGQLSFSEHETAAPIAFKQFDLDPPFYSPLDKNMDHVDGQHATGDDSQHGGDQKKFACPFYKQNMQKYISERSCAGPGWTTVRRVK